MQTVTGAHTKESTEAGAATPDDGVLVVVRPDVVETADHVLGNLFQRLYHGIERVGRIDDRLASDLSVSLREVEDSLQLLLDYIAPFAPVTARMPAADVLESLVRNIAPGTEATLIALRAPIEGVVVAVDPSRAARTIDLLRLQLNDECPSAARVRANHVNRQLVVHIAFPPGRLRGRTSVGELRWAVAEKLVEIHGGALRKIEPNASGEIEWTLCLPSLV